MLGCTGKILSISFLLFPFFQPMLCFNKEMGRNDENAEIHITKLNSAVSKLYSSNQMMSLEYIAGIVARLDNGSSKEPDDINTVRSFMPKTTKHRHRFHHYVFEIRLSSPTEQIRRVEIRFLNTNNVITGTTPVKIKVEQDEKVLEKYNSYKDTYLDGKYSVMNLSNIIIPILKYRQENITVKVTLAIGLRQKSNARDNNIHDDAILVIFSRDHGYFHNIYTHFLQVNGSSRGKRAVQQRRRERHGKELKQRKICQLENFDIDFGYTGFGQIIYPKTFNARQCTGACPSPISSKFFPTNHVMLQSLMRLGRPEIAPMPPCVPISYKPLKIIYREDSGETITKTYDNMIAASCGCR